MSAREQRLQQQVGALQRALRRADLLTRHDSSPAGRRHYGLPRGLVHELETARRLADDLATTLAPKPAPAAKLPGIGTVAWAVLEALEVDYRAHQHPHLAMLAGLTDAQLAVRVRAAGGANSVRPRRIELTRRGLVEQVPDTDPAQPARWRISALAHALLEEAHRFPPDHPHEVVVADHFHGCPTPTGRPFDCDWCQERAKSMAGAP